MTGIMEVFGKYIDDVNDGHTTNLMGSVKQIINVVLGVIGVVAVVMIILGGVSYTTSQGDPEKIKKGKNTILYGIIGLVVAMLAFAVVNFVLKNVFGGGTAVPSGPGGSAAP